MSWRQDIVDEVLRAVRDILEENLPEVSEGEDMEEDEWDEDDSQCIGADPKSSSLDTSTLIPRR